MIRLSSPLERHAPTAAVLTARRMDIDTYREPVVYMRSDCEVCRSEGFEARSRVRVSGNDRSLIATLNVVHGDLVAHGEIGLSESAWTLLQAERPVPVRLSHPAPLESFRHVRAKLFDHALAPEQLAAIIDDVAAQRYSDVQLSAFLTACVGDRMSAAEIVALTRAMVSAGRRLHWPGIKVFDKHCVGGLPGNRTTPIVVAIATACGLTMPKTSSRAITSPAGTADTMETLTRVDLSLDEIREVVSAEGGCLAWGGAVALSPADDVLVRIERALDIDSEAQLVASVLSKKVAAGSTHVVIDMPVGPTAKVRDRRSADRLARILKHTGAELELNVRIAITDGSRPIGCGIGPALEARDVLAVLQSAEDAPADLRLRAALLAGQVLELGGIVGNRGGQSLALEVLDDGRAWRKFQAICTAQGGLKQPPGAKHRHAVLADHSGRITTIDNRRLAMVAKLAGAPNAPAAGVDLHRNAGDNVEEGSPVFTVHAEALGELYYALGYLEQNTDLVTIDGASGPAP